MKFSKKFIEDLHKIGEWAFIEKNQWIGKLVPDIIVDNLQKRGISQEDIEGAVVLTVEEAKQLQEDFLDIVCEIVRLVGRYGVKYEKPDSLIILEGRIEQAEKGDA